MTKKTPHVRGTMLLGVEARLPWEPEDRPDWFTDPRRTCSPTRLGWEAWTSENRHDRDRAAKRCKKAPCPFLRECRAWAVEHRETWGVWGGRNLGKADDGGAAAVKVPLPGPDVLDEAVLVAATLDHNGFLFAKLTPAQKTVVVLAGRRRGQAWTDLARRLRTRISDLQILAGEPGPTFDEQVRTLHGQGLSDPRIATALGVGTSVVRTSRRLQDLTGVRNTHPPRTIDDALVNRIRELWAQDLSDSDIGLRLGRHPSVVSRIRKDVLQLPSNFGPGGRRLRAGVPA